MKNVNPRKNVLSASRRQLKILPFNSAGETPAARL
jgi:hypothetical protein